MRQRKPAAPNNQPLNIFIAVVLACCVAAGLFYVLRQEARVAVEQMLAGKKLESPGALATEIFDIHGKKVGEIADVLRDRFGEAIEPAEERLGQLVWVMRREWLIEYSGIDDE